CRRLVAQGQHRLPGRTRHPGRSRLGEQLPRLPRARGLRRVQVLGHRTREPQDDARPLPADEEPAGQLFRECTGILLMSDTTESAVLESTPTIEDEEKSRVAMTQAAIDLLATLVDKHGQLMFHQSGGCCDGSSPMCFPEGDFLTSDADVLLGHFELPIKDTEKAGLDFWMSAEQFEYWKHTHLTLDVVPGRCGGFGVESTTGNRFIIRSELMDVACTELRSQRRVGGVSCGRIHCEIFRDITVDTPAGRMCTRPRGTHLPAASTSGSPSESMRRLAQLKNAALPSTSMMSPSARPASRRAVTCVGPNVCGVRVRATEASTTASQTASPRRASTPSSSSRCTRSRRPDSSVARAAWMDAQNRHPLSLEAAVAASSRSARPRPSVVLKKMSRSVSVRALSAAGSRASRRK